jgi:hypothetical protein
MSTLISILAAHPGIGSETSSAEYLQNVQLHVHWHSPLSRCIDFADPLELAGLLQCQLGGRGMLLG